MDNDRRSALALFRWPSWRILSIVCLLTLTLSPAVFFRFLPFNDYHQWVFQGYLVQKLHEAPTLMSQYYGLAKAPVPNNAFLAVAWPLSYLVSSPEAIAKSFVLLAISIFVLGAVFLIRSVQQRPTAVEFLPFVWAYGYYLYNGFLSYYFSLGLVFFGIGYLHRATRGGQRTPCIKTLLVLSLLSTLLYFSHLFSWIPFCIAVVVYSITIKVQTRNYSGLWVVGSLIPAVLLLIWYMLDRSASNNSVPVVFYTSLPNKLASFVSPLLLFFRLDPFDLQVPASLMLNGFMLGAVFILVVRLAKCQPGSRRKLSIVRTPMLVSAVCLVCVTLIPFSWFGGMGWPDGRFVQPAFWLAVASILYRPRALRQEAFLFFLALFTLAANVFLLARIQVPLSQILDATGHSISQDARVFSVSMRNPPLWNACSEMSILDSTIGIHSLQWFDLYRFMSSGGVEASIFNTAMLIPKHTDASPRLAILEVPRTKPEESAKVILDKSRDYQFVELFGCPSDIRAFEQLLDPVLQPLTSGMNFSVLSRKQ